MNPVYLGDSYDIVKRFFCDAARSLGYAVYIDPMYTGNWTQGQTNSFLQFLGARPLESAVPESRAALLMDPDIGIRARPSARHITFDAIAARCSQFPLLIVFDQSFSRGPAVQDDLIRKLLSLRTLGVRGVYYDSHARFLICGNNPAPVMRFQKALMLIGLPAARFVGIPASAA